MVDFNSNPGCVIYNELSPEEVKHWFNFKQKKNLRTIDTFYYSIKLFNDFTIKSEDMAVKKFRNDLYKKKSELLSYGEGVDSVLFFVPGLGNINLTKRYIPKFYEYVFEVPDYFDIGIAHKVPGGSEGQSVTSEITVQIRSYMLWSYGADYCFNESYKWVKAICSMYGFEIDKVTEQRIDYCWHSNYFQSPSSFFKLDNIYLRKVSHFQDGLTHSHNVGSYGYDIDYFCTGKRTNGLFFRAYNKTKEVLEENYKDWFFKIWQLSGLINNYDMYCYEKAFLHKDRRSRYNFLYIARLQWYLEFGSDPGIKEDCKYYIDQFERYHLVGDDIIKLCNKCTPKLNTIINVEFETRRRWLKTLDIVHDLNQDKNEASRVFDVLDNSYIIGDYLLNHVLKFVDESDPDPNKARKKLHPFWNSLYRTKMLDFKKLPKGIKKKKEKHRELNMEKIKRRLINDSVTLGFYQKGYNEDDALQDFYDMIPTLLNDNDIKYANKIKLSKLANLSPDFKDLQAKHIPDNFVIVDKNDGTIYEKDNIVDLWNKFGFFDSDSPFGHDE